MIAAPRWNTVLRALREARGVTQEGWAARLGVGRRTVQRWESGEVVPDAVAEAAVLSYCHEKGLLRAYDQGPLAGVSVSAEWLRNLLAEARLDLTAVGHSVRAALIARDGARASFGDLPIALTSFIGREREIAEIADLLGRARLVTLVGPGGTGKTRLALAVAEQILLGFPDGASFVDLTSITDPALVPSLMLQVLGLREDAGRPPIETLTEHLRTRRMLLVIDNAEHVAEAAPVLRDLLERCSGITALVTSRVVLHLRGEHEYPVQPLPLPDLNQHRPIEGLARNSAVGLFLDRARAVRPDFSLQPHNATAVAQICRRLDGLPLAIELAASRTKLFEPLALLSRLEAGPTLLVRGGHDHPERHRSLQAAIRWSYELLGERERRFVRRLAVFSGGWTLAAAQAVCAADGDLDIDPLEGIAALMDSSLAQRIDGPEDEPRFTMLVTIREFMLDQLAFHGEVETLRRRHAAYFLEMAERADRDRVGPAHRLWLARLEREHDNLRAALDWCLSGGDPEGGVRLAALLGDFWSTRGHGSEGLAWLERALTVADHAPSGMRARLLWEAGWMYVHHPENLMQGRTCLEESLRLCRAIDDRRGIARSLRTLGDAASLEGDTVAAQAFFEESLNVARETGDRTEIAQSLNRLGHMAFDQAEYAVARARYEESLSLARAAGDDSTVAWTLRHLGMVALSVRDDAEAERRLSESLGLMRDLADLEGMWQTLAWSGFLALRRVDASHAAACFREGLLAAQREGSRLGMGSNLVGCAAVAIRAGQLTDAARLFAAAEQCPLHLDPSLAPVARAAYERMVADLRTRLGNEAFEASWAEGAAMSLDDAIALALETADG